MQRFKSNLFESKFCILLLFKFNQLDSELNPVNSNPQKFKIHAFGSQNELESDSAPCQAPWWETKLSFCELWLWLLAKKQKNQTTKKEIDWSVFIYISTSVAWLLVWQTRLRPWLGTVLRVAQWWAKGTFGLMFASGRWWRYDLLSVG